MNDTPTPRTDLEAKLRIELRGHPDCELWGDAGLIAAIMRWVDALDKAIEHRDLWREANGKIRYYAKQLERELAAMTEQRDDAREEIKQLKEKRCEFCQQLPQTENEKAYASEFADKKGELPIMDEWLQKQALTQTEQTK